MAARKRSKKTNGRVKRAGVSGYNKPKRTPSHPKKSHIVVAKVGDKIKTIRFGQQGAKTAGKPKAGKLSVDRSKHDTLRILQKDLCLQHIGLIK